MARGEKAGVESRQAKRSLVGLISREHFRIRDFLPADVTFHIMILQGGSCRSRRHPTRVQSLPYCRKATIMSRMSNSEQPADWTELRKVAKTYPAASGEFKAIFVDEG